MIVVPGPLYLYLSTLLPMRSHWNVIAFARSQISNLISQTRPTRRQLTAKLYYSLKRSHSNSPFEISLQSTTKSHLTA
jgi:hypothetical protein